VSNVENITCSKNRPNIKREPF